MPSYPHTIAVCCANKALVRHWQGHDKLAVNLADSAVAMARLQGYSRLEEMFRAIREKVAQT
jgi:hypothetical protein